MKDDGAKRDRWRIIVTGGAGFIGSCAVRRLVSDGAQVLNVDILSYAGDVRRLSACADQKNYTHLCADIADAARMRLAFTEFQPTHVLHLAAESHVDRSIEGPAAFAHANLMGTFSLLEAARSYWNDLSGAPRQEFRFVHVSTDEVYGSLGEEGAFDENTAYAPNSPYSATKAGSDHLVRAWFKTFGLPAVITNCSNNYGAYQHPEKLIPTVIRNAINGAPIPIYGAGNNVRDWLFVEDHVDALILVADRARPGAKYNIGGCHEVSNLDLVGSLCEILDRKGPRSDKRPYGDQISFVQDRPGHDFRYAVDAKRIESELGWRPKQTLAEGLEQTVDWYLEHADWLMSVADAGRLGVLRERV